MATTQLLRQRFNELAIQAAAVEATKRAENDGYINGVWVDNDTLVNWALKVRNLLSSACGRDSEHYKAFGEAEKGGSFTTNFGIFGTLRAIFNAAKEDYEGGYLSSVRNLVQAEVFSSELDQARELLTSGYKSSAAVVGGIVLETALRQMCEDRGIAVGKLDRMNADLSKAGAYTSLVQKRVISLAAVRNSAAHGHPEMFSEADVLDLINYTEQFLGERW